MVINVKIKSKTNIPRLENNVKMNSSRLINHAKTNISKLINHVKIKMENVKKMNIANLKYIRNTI